MRPFPAGSNLYVIVLPVGAASLVRDCLLYLDNRLKLSFFCINTYLLRLYLYKLIDFLGGAYEKASNGCANRYTCWHCSTRFSEMIGTLVFLGCPLR